MAIKGRINSVTETKDGRLYGAGVELKDYFVENTGSYAQNTLVLSSNSGTDWKIIRPQVEDGTFNGELQSIVNVNLD